MHSRLSAQVDMNRAIDEIVDIQYFQEFYASRRQEKVVKDPATGLVRLSAVY